MILGFEQWLRQSHGASPDLCIIGAGPAGLEIARHFANSPTKVLFLEAGASHVDPALQKFSRVLEPGKPMRLPDKNSPLSASGFPEGKISARVFGGTASLGSGRWKVPDEIDFEDRAWIQSPGWPLTWMEVSPFVVEVLQSHRIPHAKMMPAQAKTIQSVVVTPHFVAKAVTDFGRDLRDSLDASTSVTALLRACAVELLPAPGGSTVEAVLVVDQKGQTHRVSAKRFVVAVGGLETARLFLNSTRFGGHGPGNRRGFVGSQFIDHATMRIGSFHPMRGAAGAGVLGNTVKGPHGIQTRLTLAAARQRDLGIGNHAFELVADHASKKGMMQSPSHHVHLIVEQTPSELCNVSIDPEKDLNCARLARVNWALSPEDREGAKKFVVEMKRNLDPQYGTLEVDESVWENDDWRVCGHQMGTTRMARTAGEGVIDVDCRVFGTNNLFVAGSAIFPVGGNADPLVLILALARRLAKHLQG